MGKVLALYRSLLSTYRALIYLGIVSAVAELAYGVMNQSAIPPYVQELGLTAHIGLIYAGFLVVETIFKSPMGSLGDRLGRRPPACFWELDSFSPCLRGWRWLPTWRRRGFEAQ